MLTDILYLILGLAMLTFGGDWLVRGSVRVAERFGISQLLIGMVLVGFGTSTPELLVSVKAALAGQPDIALGNIVGSNIANVLLIMGLCAVICPIACDQKGVQRDTLAVIGASLLLAVLSIFGVINAWIGVLFLILMAAYVVWCYRAEKADGETMHADMEVPYHDTKHTTQSLLVAIGLATAGLVLLIFGARFLVDGAINIARVFGVSEAVIGLTLVAVGTSLPELAAGISAAIKKNSAIVVGNILGSNLYNILFILGLTGVIIDVPFAGRIAELDVWIMLGVAMILVPIIWTGKRVSRNEGLLMLGLYVLYCTTMAVS